VKSSVIARRYAKALILIGREDNRIDDYREAMGAFLSLLDREKQLAQVISNPVYSTANRRNVLQAVLEKTETPKVISAFLMLLFDKGRIVFLPGIYEYYNKLADEAKGIVKADLVSASELTSEVYEQIRGALSKLTGKEVVLEAKQDPALIGGVVTRIGDLVLDGSVRTQLQNMRESLKRGESA
jgi:F-type H+-transporting ATPase subunit delta